MKMHKTVIYILFSLMFIIVFIFSLDRFVSGISLNDLSLFKSRKYSAFTIADEVGDLYLLNTSEYRMKIIFPHDFVERDFDWWKVKEIYERDLTYSDDLSNEMAIYESCINAGFDPALEIYEFIILTAVVKAGINISGTTFENPEDYDLNLLEKFVRIEKNENERDSISIFIPEIEITDYYIEDRNLREDNFPDAELTPGQWKDLITFLNPLVIDEVVHLGILENARENSKTLIEKIMMKSGFSEVNFIGQKL